MEKGDFELSTHTVKQYGVDSVIVDKQNVVFVGDNILHTLVCRDGR